jgi:hypothetical protein
MAGGFVDVFRMREWGTKDPSFSIPALSFPIFFAEIISTPEKPA